MILSKLRSFLDTHAVRYTTCTHSVAFTAQELARTTHLPGRDIAKTVVVWMDGSMALAVLPATHVIDFGLLRKGSGAKEMEIASEPEFKDAFPECELGAMPPFGNLFNMRTFVDIRLAEDNEIAFNAGNHREMVKLSYSDFERLVKPLVFRFAMEKRSSVSADPVQLL